MGSVAGPGASNLMPVRFINYNRGGNRVTADPGALAAPPMNRFGKQVYHGYGQGLEVGTSGR